MGIPVEQRTGGGNLKLHKGMYVGISRVIQHMDDGDKKYNSKIGIGVRIFEEGSDKANATGKKKSL